MTTEVLTTYIWYLVVAGPGGGMAIMPSAFDTREQCAAAIVEYQKQPAQAGWSLACVPSAASYFDEEIPEGQPERQ